MLSSHSDTDLEDVEIIDNENEEVYSNNNKGLASMLVSISKMVPKTSLLIIPIELSTAIQR